MKKLLSLLLALSLALSLVACSGGDTPKTDAGEKDKAQTGQMGDLLSKSYSDIMKSGKYYMHYKGNIEADGETITADMEMAMDGENMATKVTMGEGFSSHMIVKDGFSYLIDNLNKTYTKLEMPKQESDIPNTETMEYTGKGTGTVNGKELPYEEYKVDTGTLRYYFEDKKLYAIEMNNEDSSMLMEVIELSDKIPDGMMEVPEGYTEGPGYGGSTIPEELIDDKTMEDIEALKEKYENLSPEELEALEKQSQEFSNNYGTDSDAEG